MREGRWRQRERAQTTPPFVSFLVFLLLLIDSADVLKRRGGLGKVALTNTGPNDAERVVWANSFFSFVF